MTIILGAKGVKFTLTMVENTTPLDISSFGTHEIIWVKPDGTEVAATAAFSTNGTDGKMFAESPPTLFDTAGDYIVRGHLLLDSSHEFYSEGFAFTVKARTSP